MTQVRICNRCGGPVPSLAVISEITIPTADPATNPGQVTGDFAVGLSVTIFDTNVDLCPTCQVSAYVEYALAAGAELSAGDATTLKARVDSVLDFIIGGG